ncbi:syntaxin-1A-like isoform X2 [Vespa velutina]|uniref:syntaxin-1A-like isoform X2 n=1 Tax=Vespa velutina TaxID=202808 RepID=UPI001FB408C0|nr:syntaxin-1A-like isoform X2 [Vespa velutina]
MVRDRLPDLCACRNSSTTFGRGFLQDVHIQIAQNKKLKEVLMEVEEVRGFIQLLVENISVVKDLHNNVLSHTSKDMQRELEIRTQTISQTALHIQQKLRGMKENIAATDSFNTDNTKETPAHIRIRRLQYATMLKMFSDIMEDYNASLLRYHDKCLQLLQQQRMLSELYIIHIYFHFKNKIYLINYISILVKKHTTYEIDETDNIQGNSIFVDNILEDSKITKEQLSAIEVRHNEVLKLEKSIHEIKDMFTETAFLIEKQGEQINSVEYFAKNTTDDVESGKKCLNKAEERSHRYKKRKIKIGIIIGIIIFVIILILVFLN